MLAGYPARERRLVDAANTIYSVKRLIGRPFKSEEVRRAIERLPFAFEEGPTGGRAGGGARRDLHAARDQRVRAARRARAGRGGAQAALSARRDHGARQLQRAAALGHQGRRARRRARGAAHPQRAHGGGARVRLRRRQDARARRRLRPRRRHVRHHDPRSRRRRVRGRGHRGRHVPRRRRHRRRWSPTRWCSAFLAQHSLRRAQRPAGLRAPARRGRVGQVPALDHRGRRAHGRGARLRRRRRGARPEVLALARSASRSCVGRSIARTFDVCEEALRIASLRPTPARSSDPGRRQHAHAARARDGGASTSAARRWPASIPIWWSRRARPFRAPRSRDSPRRRSAGSGAMAIGRVALKKVAGARAGSRCRRARAAGPAFQPKRARAPACRRSTCAKVAAAGLRPASCACRLRRLPAAAELLPATLRQLDGAGRPFPSSWSSIAASDRYGHALDRRRTSAEPLDARRRRRRASIALPRRAGAAACST